MFYAIISLSAHLSLFNFHWNLLFYIEFDPFNRGLNISPKIKIKILNITEQSLYTFSRSDIL